jgi:hypothetical protein
VNTLRPPTPATERLAQASPDFEAKLRQAEEALRTASRAHVAIKQASSLGAEDVVISHLIARLGLPITVFVLDTGALHHQTLALLERQQAAARLTIEVHRPDASQVIQWVARHGQSAIYDRIESRKDCAGSSPTPEPMCRWSTRPNYRPWVAPSTTPWPTGPGAMCGTSWPKNKSTTTRCTMTFSRASAAPPVPVPSAWASLFGLAAGGGKMNRPKNVACT